MVTLVEPTPWLHAAWLDAHREWGAGQHEDGFGLGADDEVESAEGFAAWLARLSAQSDPSRAEAGRHRCSYWWIVDGDRVLGGAALRVGEDDYTRWAGHVGFGVRPAARGQGLGTWALGQLAERARERGMSRLVAVCAVPNDASARTIAGVGAAYDGLGETPHGSVRRFVLELRSDRRRADPSE